MVQPHLFVVLFLGDDPVFQPAVPRLFKAVIVFFRHAEVAETFAHLVHHLGQAPRFAFLVIHRKAEQVHRRLRFLRRLGQPRQDRTQRGTGLGPLDTGVGHQADRRRGVLRRVVQRAGQRRDVLERLAHHADVGVCVGRCCRQHVGEASGIIRRHAERRQRVRHDIGRSGQGFAGRGGQVHDALDAAQHIRRLPAGHGHVVHGVGGFGRGELRG